MLPEVVRIARAAGSAILPYFQDSERQAVVHKIDQSPVTQADFAAHKVISFELKKLTPHIPVLSEEEDCPPYEVRKSWEQYWLVDPLDGTRGFIRHSSEFTVNIAFIEHGKPLLGVIVQPVVDRCFYAVVGKNAYQAQAEQQPVLLSLKREARQELRILCGQFDRSIRFVKKIIPKSMPFQLIQMNSSLKFAALAQGLGDLYCRFGPTSEWDTAAGQCILEAIGGAVVDFQGEPLQYNAKSSLINPSFLAVADASQLPHYLALIKPLRREE